MKVCVLGSGSKGNATYFATSSLKCLIDLGTTSLYTVKKLAEIDVSADDIQAIFITHAHVDHISGLRVFLKKHHPTVYLTRGIYHEISKELVLTNYVFIEDSLTIDDLTIDTIKTSHDAEDSIGYIFTSNGTSMVYITDTGYIHVKYYEKLKNHHIYILESNHDIKMLMDGGYPYHIKQRILGDYGHLSNKDCSNYLDTFVGDQTKYIILAHLSEHNNTKELAQQSIQQVLEHHPNTEKLIITNQSERTEVIEV